jgi:hypothetical protein
MPILKPGKFKVHHGGTEDAEKSAPKPADALRIVQKINQNECKP